MAYLNAQERQNLANNLKDLKFGRAQGKLRSMNGRLRYYRNAQYTNRYSTRYMLDEKGVIVTLVELLDKSGGKNSWTYDEVIVEPTADNLT
ncbi:hypothetical protein MASR2M15_15440 [Anaerolineales bacterium]